MIEYIKAQQKINSAIIKNKFTVDELHRFSKSDSHWIDNKGKEFKKRKIKKGEIYQFEFGKNYTPEMSYEHRGLVIGVKNNMLYVLPICSYDPKKHSDVYHSKDFPNSKSDYYLLKNSEFACIKHDSVLKLNDIRTISINRILYQHDGNIPHESDTYKNIETLVLKKYFAEFYYEYEKEKKTINALKEENDKMREKATLLENDNAKLLEEIKGLKEKLEKR